VLVARFMSWCKNAAQQGIGAGERRSGARGSMPKTLDGPEDHPMSNPVLLVTLGATAIALGVCLFVAGGLQGESFFLFHRVNQPMELYLLASGLIACGVGSIVFGTRSRWSARLEVE
jgi:hypothetical protein